MVLLLLKLLPPDVLQVGVDQRLVLDQLLVLLLKLLDILQFLIKVFDFAVRILHDTHRLSVL